MKTQIERHEKAIEVLEAIDRITDRIMNNSYTAAKMQYNGFGRLKEHYESRVDIDSRIKDRLKNYYKNYFQI